MITRSVRSTSSDAPNGAEPDAHADDLRAGKRFPFGANWRRFLAGLTPARIAAAEQSLRDMLNLTSLGGRTFLDVGSGSGLFSLAARRLGAVVRSFDDDPESVECTRELRRRYFDADQDWSVDRGSILDDAFVGALGKFDVVYAWGVLHHTGDMWRALDRVARLVGPEGRLFIALYNDQGLISLGWRQVKRLYCAHAAGRVVVTSVAVPVLWAREGVARVLRPRRGVGPRGMSAYHDWIDWLGGYPFEVATPDAIGHFYQALGFDLVRQQTTRRLGCNQFVFARRSA
jgi:2-polyprenyl-3-methyl-5-hydroxy-6-metoxy-1,4-benzoquinol methylase